MKAVVRNVWRVLLLKVGPAALPRSWTLLAGVTLAYLATDVLGAWLYGYAPVPAVQQSAMDVGLQVLLLAALLSAKFLLPRLNRALTAWLGAGVILNLVGLPLDAGFRLLPKESAELWLAVPYLMLLAWSIMVLAWILREALDTNVFTAFVAAIACVLATTQIIGSLFPL